ncbi:member of major facilitator superfamily multidrug-resistance, DHA1 sub-family [Pterulicium gracile]|uniref:Member of major facilitator superfamily multidrug-resistance, DHA1 sub-family n=1 Tax=Pterulicium gracile TaxID=1884261 RepID=A0A5C3QJV4_9AGAR|nr:member of major facilitator superfamily multidrug-resistance, DHA1 sub-family [Pterula gracilis]
MTSCTHNIAGDYNDEETPLLVKKPRTPLPWFQLSIVLFLQMAEPLTSQVLYPFGPQLMRDIGITHGDETKVGYYVGLMQSLFFFSQALTVMHWSSISDRIGRKPVILFGLVGLSLTMYGFGLSTTFTWLVLTRCLCGALNGNIGVIKSIMAEITDETNRAQMFAFVPMAWSAGGTLGPLVGGWLSRPAEGFPGLFGDSTFHKNHPYFLACAVPATISLIAWFVTLFFLEETVSSPVPVTQFVRGDAGNEHLPEDCSDSSSERTRADYREESLHVSAVLTPRVLLASANYALICLVDISFRALQPVFFATPLDMGGLGFEPSTIGMILSTYGILNCVFQLCFFAKIHSRIGTKRVMIMGLAAAVPGFALFPVMNAFGRRDAPSWLLWSLILAQVGFLMLLNMTYGAIFIYVTASAPNKASLGTVNGFGQMLVSLARTVGPAFTNSLFSMTMQHHYLSGLAVYIAVIGMTLFSISVARRLPQRAWEAA